MEPGTAQTRIYKAQRKRHCTEHRRRSTSQHAASELECAEAAIQQAFTMQQLVNASPGLTHRRLSSESESPQRCARFIHDRIVIHKAAVHVFKALFRSITS